MDISELQTALNQLGASPKLVVDGISGALTKAAVEAYQKARGLSIDGIVGPITGASIAADLQAAGLKPTRGIQVELAGILDCTSWDMPEGGWPMPPNVGIYRFFYQPAFPGGGYGAVAANNQQLSTGHVYVPVDPAVLAWAKSEATRIVNGFTPGTKFFALLIRGLTFGVDSLSPLESIEAELQALGVECQIVSEGLFAHDLQNDNYQILVTAAQAGKRVMLLGHSMGGDEVPAICAMLNVATA